MQPKSVWISFLLAFTALLPLINPIGSALIFLGLVGDESAAVYRQLARKIAMATILFLMVIVQASFWFLAKDAALAAARQGADAARSLGSTTTAGPAAAIAFARRASGYLLDPSASATASRTTVTVTVTGTVPSFVPGLPIGISETAQAPIEQFQP